MGETFCGGGVGVGWRKWGEGEAERVRGRESEREREGGRSSGVGSFVSVITRWERHLVAGASSGSRCITSPSMTVDGPFNATSNAGQTPVKRRSDAAEFPRPVLV